MEEIKPLVSCIMPTANRAAFIPFAINNFLKQDYPNKELIIVDDGRESIISLLPHNDQIKHIQLPTSNNVIGLKRNLACEAANGEIVMHMDDDDWYAPDWISYQTHILNSSGADICGLGQLFFYDSFQNKAWKYIYPPEAQAWVASATMAYKKSFWAAYPFKDVHVGEGALFTWNLNAKVFVHDYTNGFISLLHSKNTSPKATNNSRWVPHPIKDVLDIVSDSVCFPI